MIDIERKDKILEYIGANLGCTKTSLEDNLDMASRTVRRYLKELIEEDKKVICIIDKVNPRIHHLFLNDPIKLAVMNLKMSKAEELMKNQKHMTRYTVAPLVNGGFAIASHDGWPPVMIQHGVEESVKNLIESASRLKSIL
ncbi:MAG TPA: hypothetical protein VGE97_02675 [Nitrososphaera sp.]|jgi:hypothetical protein